MPMQIVWPTRARDPTQSEARKPKAKPLEYGIPGCGDWDGGLWIAREPAGQPHGPANHLPKESIRTGNRDCY